MAAAAHLALRLQLREVVAHVVFEMRRDGALVERFAGRSLILGQHLLVGHQRGVVRAGQVALPLLHLALAARPLLPLDHIGLAGLSIRIVGLIHQAAVAIALVAAAESGLGRIVARLPVLLLPRASNIRSAAAGLIGVSSALLPVLVRLALALSLLAGPLLALLTRLLARLRLLALLPLLSLLALLVLLTLLRLLALLTLLRLLALLVLLAGLGDVLATLLDLRERLLNRLLAGLLLLRLLNALRRLVQRLLRLLAVALLKRLRGVGQILCGLRIALVELAGLLA